MEGVKNRDLVSYIFYLKLHLYPFIFIFIFLASISYLYILTIEDKYKTSTFLEFSNSENTNYIQTLIPINIAGNSNQKVSKFDKANHLLFSFNFFEFLIKNENFLLELQDFDNYSKLDNKDIFLKPNPNIKLDNKTKWELFSRFKNFIELKNGTNGIAEFSVTHYSPNISNNWSNFILSSLDEYIKLRDFNEINRKINFYEQKYAEINIKELNLALSDLLIAEIKKLSYMDSSDNYLFSIIDKPTTPHSKYYPSIQTLTIYVFSLIFLLTNFLFFILFILNLNLKLVANIFPIRIKKN